MVGTSSNELAKKRYLLDLARLRAASLHRVAGSSVSAPYLEGDLHASLLYPKEPS